MLDGRDLGTSRKCMSCTKASGGGLSLQWSDLEGCSEQSTLRVYRYTGHFEARHSSDQSWLLSLEGGGAVPLALVSATEVGD